MRAAAEGGGLVIARDRTQFGVSAIMRAVTNALRGTDTALAELYDVALLDLDGVVYVGRDAVPAAASALSQVRERGMRIAFVTNNAARPPAEVAAHLVELGIAAEPGEVVNSAQAAAHYLADRLPHGAAVLVVGTTGLWEALRERGLNPVERMDDRVAAVVQGYSPELSWRQLAEGAVAIRAGVPWVATNLDATVPSPRGPLPGNGSMVAALRHATGATPVVTGKPEPTMHREMVSRTGAQRPLIVGDRLETDIAGATAVGCPSLLVLTGVTSPAMALAAPPPQRATYLGADLRALLAVHPEPVTGPGFAVCGQWRATVRGAGLRLAQKDAAEAAHAADADGSDDGLDAWRALCAAWWPASEDGGEVTVRADDAAAEAELERLGIGGERVGGG
jgi:HAD superfamily hydrolase (TIGR01450 family)